MPDPTSATASQGSLPVGAPEKRDPTLPELIAEAQRELNQRRKVYPRWIAEKRIDKSTADHRTACMAHIEAVLRNLHLGLSYHMHFVPRPDFAFSPEIRKQIEAAGLRPVAEWIDSVFEALKRDVGPLMDASPSEKAPARGAQGSLL